MKNITVLIAEDHTIVREGLLMLLKREEGIEVIAQVEDGREAVKLAAKLQPDVIVMDIAMPHLNGIEATRQIMQARPDAKVLILSAHADDAYVQTIMALGASGYLIKQIAAEVLPEAIRRVHQGKKCLSPTIAERRNHHRPPSNERGETRTHKERPTFPSRVG